MNNWLALCAAICCVTSAINVQAGLTTLNTSSSDGTVGTLDKVMDTLLGTSFDVTSGANRIQDFGPGVTDQVWSPASGATTTTLVLELAGNAGVNSFGIYNLGSQGQMLQVFSGANSSTLSRTISFNPDTGLATVIETGAAALIGSQFGFYLDGKQGTFYSQQAKNSNGKDFMVTLRTDIPRTLNLGALAKPGLTGTVAWGANEYLLGWEDLSSGSDRDFQDMVVKVSAVPVPEPTTILAGSLLLLPFGLSTLRMLRRRA